MADRVSVRWLAAAYVVLPGAMTAILVGTGTAARTARVVLAFLGIAVGMGTVMAGMVGYLRRGALFVAISSLGAAIFALGLFALVALGAGHRLGGGAEGAWWVVIMLPTLGSLAILCILSVILAACAGLAAWIQRLRKDEFMGRRLAIGGTPKRPEEPRQGRPPPNENAPR